MSKMETKEENEVITMELILLILITILFINQIVIILEKENLENKVTAILKIIYKKPLTKKEEKYVGKYRR